MTENRPHQKNQIKHLVGCPSCDWLHLKEGLDPGAKAVCTRCGEMLYNYRPNSVDAALAVCIASILFLLASLFTPFLTLSRTGINASISILDAVWSLLFTDLPLLGVFVMALIVVAPLLRLGLLVYVLVSIRFGDEGSWSVTRSFRLACVLEPWAMADVFLIGVVVSLIKISELAVLDVGVAFWSWVGLIVTTILINLTLSKDTVWTHLDQS